MPHEFPVKLKRRRDFAEVPEIHRLHDVGIDAQATAFRVVALELRRRENYDGNILCALVRTDATKHLDAVELRQFQVE